jgi:UDP-glucose 4-epimerase
VRILIVGGAGFVGSVVAAGLGAAGHDLTVCDNLSTGNAWAIEPARRFVPVDLADRAALRRVLADGYDAVVDVIGLGNPSSSLDPIGSLRASVGGSLNLLEAMAEHGVRRLVYSSGAAEQRTMEEFVRFATLTGGLGAVGLRLFQVAGAHGPLGEWHHPETHLVPLVLQAAAGVRPTVRVFGTDYDTPDGTAVRDYVHVEDVARAYRLALAATAEPGHAGYDIGTGTGWSVRQVIEVAREVTGRPIRSIDAPRRAGDVSSLVATPDPARVDLGWMPAQDLARVMADAWSWMLYRLGGEARAAEVLSPSLQVCEH